MFRVSTGEGWHDVMNAMARPGDFYLTYQCINQPTYEDYAQNNYQELGCGNSFSSIAFFVSFVIIVSLVFLNLFVAIILEGFEDTQTTDN